MESVYNLIKDDSRHTSVNRRSFEPISERVFPSWEMGYKDLSAQELAMQTDATPADKEKFEKLLNAELDFDNSGMRILQLFFRA